MGVAGRLAGWCWSEEKAGLTQPNITCEASQRVASPKASSIGVILVRLFSGQVVLTQRGATTGTHDGPTIIRETLDRSSQGCDNLNLYKAQT